MPYIKQTRRQHLETNPTTAPDNAGELNYLITDLIIDYINAHGQSYQTYNDIIGALEGAKYELYRRQVAPYEDEKIVENGDVYQ